ncbi:MAG: GntR family transcriptional regulator [Phycisphaerae bacterium]|jgi:DNA-binding FadR family transcriptional regulator
MTKNVMINDIDVVNKEPLSQVLIARIKSYIAYNGLRPGDRLPTEQELAERFGVSRLSVREATKTLGFLGILRSAPQRGLTVATIDLKRLSEYLGFHFAINDYPKERLLQARIVIETGAIFYMTKAMAVDVSVYDKLNSIISNAEITKDLDSYIDSDIEFHRGLVAASGVEPLIAFNDLLHVFFAKFRHEVDKAHSTWAEGLNEHQQILNYLREEKSREAEDLLRKHLEYYEKSL